MCRADNSWPCGDVDSYYCPYWGCISWAIWQSAKYEVLLHKRISAPDCTPGTCNPVHFTVLKPSDWTQGHIISIRIDGKGLDPRTLIHLKFSNWYPWEFLIPNLSLLFWGDEEWIFILYQGQKLVPLTGWVYSPATECHFMLCLWGDQHGETTSLGKPGSWTHKSLLMRLLSQNIGKASGS
jgi:hypothetical protein